MQQLTSGSGDMTKHTSDDLGQVRATRSNRDGDDRPSSTVNGDAAGRSRDDEALRRNRRTLAQREAAARSDLAAVAAERRRRRTRGSIIAGGVLITLLRARPELAADVAKMIESLGERDREAFRLFAPGTEGSA